MPTQSRRQRGHKDGGDGDTKTATAATQRWQQRGHKDGSNSDGNGDNGNEGNDEDDDTDRRKEGGERTGPQHRWSNKIESNHGWPIYGDN